ncbi:MAG: hypothetical protein LBJ10_09120 [Clostridiales bacterium]|nr:hypothetical protein [Clostridiales bacterium]
MQSANGSLKTKIINAMLKAAASVIKTDFIERQGEEYLERLLSDMMGLIPVNFLLPKDFDDGCFERILSEFYESEISIEVNGIMFSSKGKSIIIDEFDALKPSSDDDLEWW